MTASASSRYCNRCGALLASDNSEAACGPASVPRRRPRTRRPACLLASGRQARCAAPWRRGTWGMSCVHTGIIRSMAAGAYPRK